MPELPGHQHFKRYPCTDVQIMNKQTEPLLWERGSENGDLVLVHAKPAPRLNRVPHDVPDDSCNKQCVPPPSIVAVREARSTASSRFQWGHGLRMTSHTKHRHLACEVARSCCSCFSKIRCGASSPRKAWHLAPHHRSVTSLLAESTKAQTSHREDCVTLSQNEAWQRASLLPLQSVTEAT